VVPGEIYPESKSEESLRDGCDHQEDWVCAIEDVQLDKGGNIRKKVEISLGTK